MSRYMIQAYSAEDPDPVSVVSRLNSTLCQYTPVGKLVTLVYGVLDISEGEFVYVNAGHECPFLYSAKDGVLSTLDTTGPATGAWLDAECRAERVEFKPGDILVLYTDHATAARSGGEFLDTDGLEKIVSGCIKESVESLPDAIFARVESFAHGHLRDDVATLVIKAVKGATASLF